MAGSLSIARSVCLAVVLAMAGGSESAEAGVFYPTHFTLGNGLEFVVVSNPTAPVVSQMIWYKVGSADEKAGKTGLAHYLEHLMFRGTEKIPAGQFSKLIAGQGGNDNAFTSYDYTAYYEQVAADRLPMIMQMEADRMRHLRIVPETAAPELKVVAEERQQRTDNDPEGRFFEKLNARFMPGHPYGRPVIGWKKEIEKLGVADAKKFYKQHYAPNNAVVVISGDVKSEEVMRLAAAIYGGIPKQATPARPALPAFAPPRLRDMTETDAGVEQAQIIWHIAAPSFATQHSNEAYAYDVLTEALAGGEVGVLYKKLVTEEDLASAVDISYDPYARGPARVTISVAPRPGQQPKKVALALRAALREIADKGLSAAEVADAKRRMQRSALFARDSLMTPGYVFGMALATGRSVADVEEWPERIEAVTAEQVNAALDRLAENPKETLGVLMPEAANASQAGDAPLRAHEVGIR